MLRISELKLPLDHPAEALPAAIAARLGVDAGDILRWSVWKRAHDARKKAAILKVYIVDAELKDEAAVLDRLAGDPQVRPTPDTAYQPVATAPAGQRLRPVVIGAGPCGLFAGLILAEMGFRPIILDRGKAVRERTKDTWGCGARASSPRNPTSSSARAGPAPSRTASSTARSRIRASSAARC
jgi:uncharacterized FAD-dependent dehydrogenase